MESSRAEKNKGVIHLPGGLLGFEQATNYILLGSPEEAPFLWLQTVDDPDLSFLVVEPCRLCDSYAPDLPSHDTEFLGLQNPEDALVLNIVTMHPDGKATVNLKGPVVVNRYTLVGKQVIPTNIAEFSLQHPVSADAKTEQATAGVS